MSVTDPPRRVSLSVPLAVGLAVLSGCGESTPTPAPPPTAGATPPSVPAKAPKARNIGSGSNAAQDSTVN